MRYSTDTIIQVIKTYEEQPNKFKTVGDFYEISGVCNLINEISYTTTCHVNTVDNLIDALYDLRDANDKFYSVHSKNSTIGEILHWWNPEKYYIDDVHSRFYGMLTLTDSDFIDFKNLQGYSYLIYDILYNDSLGHNSPAHDIVARYYNDIKTPIARKVALTHWDTILQETIDNIDNIKTLYQVNDFRIYIPFLEEYTETANNVIKLLKDAQLTAKLLYEYAPHRAPLEHPDSYDACDPLYKIFEDWMIWLDTDGQDHIGACVIADEMTRRGFRPNRKIQTQSHNYRSYFISKEQLEISNTPPTSKKNDDFKDKSLLVKCGVLYYMLKGKIDTKLMHKALHFALQDGKHKFEGHNCKDSVYSYISHPQRFLTKSATIDRIKEKLDEYRFSQTEIDELLK